MENSKAKLIKSLIVLLMSAVFFIIAGMSYIFGWFYTGTTNKLGGFNINLVEGLNLSISLSTDGVNWSNTDELIFENFFSGHVNSKKFFVRLIYKEEKDINISLSFRSPDGYFGSEEPYINNGLYYYLGSQLQISNVKATLNNQLVDPSAYTSGTGKYLVTTTSEGVTKGQVTGVNSVVTSIEMVDIVKSFILPGVTSPLNESEAIFEIALTFVDNGQNQNVYQNSANFVCRRKLILGWEDV